MNTEIAEILGNTTGANLVEYISQLPIEELNRIQHNVLEEIYSNRAKIDGILDVPHMEEAVETAYPEAAIA